LGQAVFLSGSWTPLFIDCLTKYFFLGYGKSFLPFLLAQRNKLLNEWHKKQVGQKVDKLKKNGILIPFEL